MKKIPALDAYAEVLLYPQRDHDARVEACRDALAPLGSAAAPCLAQYARQIAERPLSAREEEYIKTFDLNKTGTLDLGWHLFGEDYNRGLFLVKLRTYLRSLNLPETRELPDHVSQVLRVLGRMSRDEAGMFSHACVIPALECVQQNVAEDSPYHPLLAGLLALLNEQFEKPDDWQDEPVGETVPPSTRLPILY